MTHQPTDLRTVQITSISTGMPVAQIERYMKNGTWQPGRHFVPSSDGSAALVSASGLEAWILGKEPPVLPMPKGFLPPAPRRPKRAMQPARTALYRHFDATGALLYVGIAMNPSKRTAAHRGSGGVVR